tara:strand:+ start:674 stop:1072 length:399 start_codon:yes stop_codon:yes gene_type:complete
MNLKTNLNVFFISSFISIITLGYIGIAYNKKNRPSTIPYELFPIFIPLLYGIFGVINYHIISNYGNNYSIIVGMIFGILLSIIGRFGLDLPIKLFNFTKTTAYQAHIYAIIMYAIIFRLFVTPLITYIISKG